MVPYMGKKHMLVIVSAFIVCFIFSAMAADVVFGGANESLKMQDSIDMTLDTEDGTNLLTMYNDTKEDELMEKDINILQSNESGLNRFSDYELFYNMLLKTDSEYFNTNGELLRAADDLFNEDAERKGMDDELLIVKVLEEPAISTFTEDDLLLFSIDDIAADEDIFVDAFSYETDLFKEIPDMTAFVMINEYDKVIADVSESMNIRLEPSIDSEIVGRLYKNGYGIIIERGEEWTKISSGGVTGYAYNDYLLFDDDARTFIALNDALVVEVTTSGVNIRSMPSIDSEIVGTAKRGDEFLAYTVQDDEEWNAFNFNGTTAYIHKDLSEVKLNLDTAKTIQEIKKKEREESIANALASAKNISVSATNRSAVSIGDEEIYLLATVIASEALSESYEGKLAVANVIINRLLKGNWGNTITKVIYAPGQFSGSNTGRFERFEKLITEDCKKAAIEALAGVNNIGDFIYFISLPKADYDKYSKFYVLGGHCFYMR